MKNILQNKLLLQVKLQACICGKKQQAPLGNWNTTSKILCPIVHVFVQLKLYSMRVELPAGTRVVLGNTRGMGT